METLVTRDKRKSLGTQMLGSPIEHQAAKLRSGKWREGQCQLESALERI